MEMQRSLLRFHVVVGFTRGVEEVFFLFGMRLALWELAFL